MAEKLESFPTALKLTADDIAVYLLVLAQQTHKTNSVALRPRANYTDRSIANVDEI
jgi:hypothetical protein